MENRELINKLNEAEAVGGYKGRKLAVTQGDGSFKLQVPRFF